MCSCCCCGYEWPAPWLPRRIPFHHWPGGRYPSKEEVLEDLKSYREQLEREIKRIEEKISEMEK